MDKCDLVTGHLTAGFCPRCGSGLVPRAPFCSGCGAKAADEAWSIETARSLLTEGDASGGREILLMLLARCSSDHEARLALASVEFQNGDWEAGRAHLALLRESGVESPVIYAYEAGALSALGHIRDAQDLLAEASRRWPTNFYVALKQGELFLRLGLYQRAVGSFETAARASAPDTASRETVRGLLRFARDKSRGSFLRTLTPAFTGWSWPFRRSRTHAQSLS